ncbi:CLUMA_CG019611, isoform A [Clunio marinus]|uniref:CLUMA_CG019611, isoform A n=1 Tax=Clunio marinus TaxID=568069 RepID=A0A1J1J2I7_9DIPT|nr:CLUMA_CG019611, isoform A [Clunio marinus]
MDIRLHHHLAQEFYRQQMLQRIPDPYSSIFPARQPPAIPPRFTLPGAEVKLQNADLWSEFHKIGTEMIITKCGRRMFPSMRVSISGLDNDQNYCVLLEMVPVADCRFKFSGSQWVPAGGAEPQSLQNIYIHPDSPALGSHWQAQPINFNKTKLTNNTLDSNGHVVLTSMHKYQPRIHIVRTSDPAQIPWSPQKSFAFNETEFVAVTAYQNDRITKLKIDNNPFAKGFRETGQSRCKRKITTSSHQKQQSKGNDDFSQSTYETEQKRIRVLSPSAFSSGSQKDDSGLSLYETSSSGTNSPSFDERLLSQRLPYFPHHPYPMVLQHYHQMINSQFMNLVLPHMNGNHSSSQRLDTPSNSSSTDDRQIDVMTDDTNSNASDENSETSPKKSNFSISAILGLEKNPYSSIFPSRQLPPLPPRFTLPEAEVKLQNADLWSEFHKIGTEMIITKCGRRMFPSMRVSISGLDNDQNYCVLLEMVPVADCRFKFSGSQWVPAGGAEPQSLQNIYIHPDSPALGSHWQAQPINFNKTKLTNNTLDSNGHVVLTSMHKYQPRIHIVRTSDPAQIPWSPQKSFAFNETEFVAVTAYQNDRITKLKIDNNPFAKGFRETGQSRCKRKITTSSHQKQQSKGNDDFSQSTYETEQKRIRVLSPSTFSAGSVEDSEFSTYETSSNGSRSPSTVINDDRQSPLCSPMMSTNQYPYALQHYHQMLGANRQWMNLVMPYINHEQSLSPQNLPSLTPPDSPTKNISISCPPQEDSPKKSNFSIAAILGL